MSGLADRLKSRRGFIAGLGAAGIVAAAPKPLLAATEKWIGGSGQGLTFGNLFSAATLNSIASGNAILSDLDIDNSTALDMFMDASFIGGSVTTTGNPFVGLYIYPRLDDATTYGDGRFGTSAAGPPPSNYLAGTLGLPVGTQAITGMFRAPYGMPILIPPGHFKGVVHNGAGVAFAGAGANTCKFRTYNRQVAEMLYGKQLVARAIERARDLRLVA